MRLKNLIHLTKHKRDQKDNRTVLILDEFYKECKSLSYRVKFKRWITFYDIETSFQVILTNSDISEFTTEILVRLKLSIERVKEMMEEKIKKETKKNVEVKEMPLKALKILVKAARKSIVI